MLIFLEQQKNTDILVQLHNNGPQSAIEIFKYARKIFPKNNTQILRFLQKLKINYESLWQDCGPTKGRDLLIFKIFYSFDRWVIWGGRNIIGK